ncbi:MAG: hypothetical protein EXR99_02145 [Gemmataceae bacterium]|nr:hypothetical protein [Gemmataceae bacterium]
MDFRPLNDEERKNLYEAIRNNSESGTPIGINPKDTSFTNKAPADTEQGVIDAIRSVPCHYGR